MFTNKRLAVIGTGAMGEAMIRGLLTQNMVAPEQIVGTNVLPDRNEYMHTQHGIEVAADNRQAVRAAEVVVLAVKPQVLGRVLHGLYNAIEHEALVLSIVAGAPISNIMEELNHTAVARAMPNTPAQIGQGVTVWTATPTVTEAQHQQAKMIFSSLGREIYVEDESYLDMATALSGTGPAYVFMMMEAMIDAGVHMGFSRRIAEELVFQTILGSVLYAEQSGRHVAELRNQVTSPGGTTAEALYHMEKGSFRTVVSRAIWAAYQRSVALGKGKSTRSPSEA